jgi:hypothetical protein
LRVAYLLRLQRREVFQLWAKLYLLLLECCNFLSHPQVLRQLTSHIGTLALHAALGPGGVAAASLSPPRSFSRVGNDLGVSGSWGLGVPKCTPRLEAAVLGGACGRVPSSAGVTIHAVSQPLKGLAERGVPGSAVFTATGLALRAVAHLRVLEEAPDLVRAHLAVMEGLAHLCSGRTCHSDSRLSVL